MKLILLKLLWPACLRYTSIKAASRETISGGWFASIFSSLFLALCGRKTHEALMYHFKCRPFVEGSCLFGIIDNHEIDEDRIIINGWLLHGIKQIRNITIFGKDGVPYIADYFLPRPDLGLLFPFVKSAHLGGFRCAIKTSVIPDEAASFRVLLNDDTVLFGHFEGYQRADSE